MIWLVRVLWIAFIFGLLEGGVRVFWAFNGLPLDSTVANIYEYFYPELKEVKPTESEEKRVLLLGGSVLQNAQPNISNLLNKAGHSYVVYPTARSAQSSRDSLIKYRLLANEKFDLVIFYHGINEVRANNIAAEHFRDDYSHYSWYEYLNTLEYHLSSPRFLLPASLHLAWVKLRQELHSDNYIPTHYPHDEYLQYGSEIKTKRAFESNLTAIIEIAKRKNEALMVMSFAWHLPNDYTFDKFKDGQLDYTFSPDIFATPTEIWGLPQNVEQGIRKHNSVIRRVVGNPANTVVFVDQEVQMPKQASYFSDICHLTPSGYTLFAKNLVRRAP